ncbi:MAG: Ca2+-dependent phosphoinositide-specific phospholipase C [Pirellulales bacterium]
MPEQFGRLNIRQIELDVFADPRGGRYARPAYFQMLRDLKQDAGDDPNLDGVLDRPGLKVFHVQDVEIALWRAVHSGAAPTIPSRGASGPTITCAGTAAWSGVAIR